jgi:hypothetical protein
LSGAAISSPIRQNVAQTAETEGLPPRVDELLATKSVAVADSLGDVPLLRDGLTISDRIRSPS